MSDQKVTIENKKMTVLGSVPSSWNVARLVQFSNEELYIKNGFPCGNWNDEGNGVLQLRPFNITNDGNISLTTQKYIETDKVLDGYLLKKKDIIFNNTNSEELVGKTALWFKEDVSAVISNHMTIIRILDESIFDQTFLASYLYHLWQIGHFHKLCRRHVNQASVSIERLKDIAIPYPTLPEQQAIARVLTTVQEAIAGQEALIAKLKELKQSMMNHLFTHGTKGEPTQITEIGEMPESWEVVKLGDIGEVSYGIQAAVASLLKPVGYKILTNKNITLDGDIVYDKINYYEPKTKRELSSFVGKGDVLLNWRSGSKEHVGKTAIYFGDEKILHSSFILRIRTNPDKVINKYLYYYINWLRETGYFVKLQTYAVNAKFNKSAVLSMDLAVPPIDQQLLMLNAFDTISTKIEVTTAKLSDYQKLFSVLLHELMSGERRVNKYV